MALLELFDLLLKLLELQLFSLTLYLFFNLCFFLVLFENNLIFDSLILNTFSLARIFDGIHSLFVKVSLLVDTGYHDCFGAASQRILEEPCELRVAVRDVLPSQATRLRP